MAARKLLSYFYFVLLSGTLKENDRINGYFTDLPEGNTHKFHATEIFLITGKAQQHISRRRGFEAVVKMTTKFTSEPR